MASEYGQEHVLDRVTKASVVVFAMLLGSYLLVLWVLLTLNAIANPGTAWWVSLIIILAVGAAAGLGYSYQVLKFLGAQDILKRLRSIPAEQAARLQPGDVTVDRNTDANTVRNLQAELDGGLIPVVDETNGTLHGIVTATDLARDLNAKTVCELMTREPEVVSLNANLADVLSVMRTTGHDNIPIVGDDGEYMGTVTPRAMLEALQMARPG